MFFPIILINLAFLLYSVAIWTEQLRGGLSRRIISVFIFGFICDVLGTFGMIAQARSHHAPISIHGLSGEIALVIMLIHLLWALKSIRSGGQSAERFNCCSPYAWCVWMIAFLSGIPVYNGHFWLVPIVVWCLFVYLSSIVQYRRQELRVPTAIMDWLTRLVVNQRYHDPIYVVAFSAVWLLAGPVISLIWTLLIGGTYVFVFAIRK